MCSNTLISSISSSSNNQTLYKKLDTESNFKQPSKAADISSFAQSSYSETSQPSSYSQYSQGNYAYSTENDQGSYNYNYKSSFQTQGKPDASQYSQASSQAPLGGYGSDALSSYDQKSNFSKSGYDSNPGQASERSLQYGYTGNDSNSNYVNQSYSAQQDQYSTNLNQQSYTGTNYSEANE